MYQLILTEDNFFFLNTLTEANKTLVLDLFHRITFKLSHKVVTVSPSSFVGLGPSFDE